MGVAQRGWRNIWRGNGPELKGRGGKVSITERRSVGMDSDHWGLVSYHFCLAPRRWVCMGGGRLEGEGAHTLPIVPLKVTEKSPWAGAWQKSSRSACVDRLHGVPWDASRNWKEMPFQNILGYIRFILLGLFMTLGRESSLHASLRLIFFTSQVGWGLEWLSGLEKWNILWSKFHTTLKFGTNQVPSTSWPHSEKSLSLSCPVREIPNVATSWKPFPV